MDDSILVALIGEALLADTPARRQAGRILLDMARSGGLNDLPMRLARQDHGQAVRDELSRLLRKFGLAAPEGGSAADGQIAACPPH